MGNVMIGGWRMEAYSTEFLPTPGYTQNSIIKVRTVAERTATENAFSFSWGRLTILTGYLVWRRTLRSNLLTQLSPCKRSPRVSVVDVGIETSTCTRRPKPPNTRTECCRNPGAGISSKPIARTSFCNSFIDKIQHLLLPYT
jgi:hypothetical protein